MDIKENTFEVYADHLVKSAQIVDHLIEQINIKAVDIDEKISVLLKKVNLKLEDSTQFLVLQKTILTNEMDYLKNLKSIISTNIKSQLLSLSENIAMFLVSVQNIYKEIPNVEVKHALVSQKKDTVVKIIADITHNLNSIRQILMDFDKFNQQFTDNINKGNFHCLTLSSDMRTVYTHIYLEYSKYVNDAENRLTYYNKFASNILEQIPAMRICNYYLPPEIVDTVASEIASTIASTASGLSSASTSISGLPADLIGSLENLANPNPNPSPRPSPSPSQGPANSRVEHL
jgi:hypothetical protein